MMACVLLSESDRLFIHFKLLSQDKLTRTVAQKLDKLML